MEFLSELKRIINSGLARSVILTGNIYDLFYDGENYVPLIQFLNSKLRVEPTKEHRGLAHVVFELNSPIDVIGDAIDLHNAWDALHSNEKKNLYDRLSESNQNATYALELLRQMAEVNRRSKVKNNLLFLVESADMLIPDSEVSRMNMQDRRRVSIVYDWFSDPAFLNSGDTAIFFSESRSSIHHRVARLPQVVSVEIPLPDLQQRQHFLEWSQSKGKLHIEDSSIESLTEKTSGLSIHALRQLVFGGPMTNNRITKKVEEYMISQLGEGIVEFQRPKQRMNDVIGNHRIKNFMLKELIPGFLDGELSGAAVGGPIGGGKTFICEAVAAELGIPVITLKNIRSKWFGETDKIFERLQRLLESFDKIVIFVDEADTQFGSIQDGHETERRLTGKIQAMMSDTALKGRVIWFLMTARIHLLSPDIRRPGRMDLIIPILDPEGDDRKEFLNWATSAVVYEDDIDSENRDREMDRLMEAIPIKASAAMFAMIRSRIKRCKGVVEAVDAIKDMVLPDIEQTREYQTLQAKINCTRKSLLFDSSDLRDCTFEKKREQWKERIEELERRGVS